MKIGLILPQGFFNEFEGWPADRAWQRMLAIAQLAERLGFDSLWTGEHVLARWGGTSPAFDCFTIGAALAAAVPRPWTNSMPGVPRSGVTQIPWPLQPASCRPGRTMVCGLPAVSG